MSVSASVTSTSRTPNRATAPRFVMIGGFLGAGKTTLASRLGAQLTAAGRRVAYISNDECSSVVDTAILRAASFQAEHVSGGSFGLRFDSLSETAARLIENSQADVIIAEPVGSAADLVNGVHTPLRRRNKFAVAPFTVVVDATRAERLLQTGRPGAASKIAYVCRKQLEEAELIVINKIDRVSEAQLKALHNSFASDFPNARLLQTSARTGAGLDEWQTALMSDFTATERHTDIDQNEYAEAESLLGCLSCTVQLSALRGFQSNPILSALAASIQQELHAAKIEMAHLKIAIVPEVDVKGVATLNIVYGDRDAELGPELDEPVERAELALNLRAEGKPDLLHAAVSNAMTHTWTAFPGLFARLKEMEHFRPHRASASAVASI